MTRLLAALGIAIVASFMTPATATAQTTVYTTTEDFAQFSNGTATTSIAFFSESGTVNGVGNSTAPGAAGTAGSLQFASAVTFGIPAGAEFTGPTNDAFQALSPGSTRPGSPESGGGPGNMLATSGTFTFDIITSNRRRLRLLPIRDPSEL